MIDKREKKNILELIDEMCPGGVEWKRLGDVITFLDGYPFKKKQFSDDGIPIIRTTNLQDGMINISTAIKCATYDASLEKYRIKHGDVLIGMSGTIKIARNLSNEEMLLNQRVGIFRESKALNNSYLYYYLCAHIDDLYDMCSGGTVINLSKKALLNFEIPIPPLAVQQEVVKVLDTFTELTTELTAKLTAELTARRKQYEYYRDELLRLDGVEGVEWKRLGDVAISISSGKNKERLNNGEYPVYGSTGIISKTNTAFYDKEQILVARVGVNAGYVHLANGQYDVSDNTLIVDVKPNYLLKYVYYSLVNMNLNQYAKGGGQPLITAGDLKKLKIAIPEYEVQKRIVSVLDNFDAICTDLNIDLPAEIEARRKQYAYYRDRLLSFPPVQ